MSKKNSMTAAEFLAMSKKSSGKKSKYGNVRTRGKHSKKEAEYGDMLQLLYENKLPFRHGGIILNIVPQYKIPVYVGDEVVCHYILDYFVQCACAVYYIDVKPTFKTEQSEKEYKTTAAYQLFNIKRKLVENKFNIKITEV